METTTDASEAGGIIGGLMLVALGISAYVVSGFASISALFPAFFGIPLVALGWVGRARNWQPGATYGIGILSGVALLGSLRGLGDVVTILTGGTVDSALAAGSQGIIFVVGPGPVLLVVKDIRADTS